MVELFHPYCVPDVLVLDSLLRFCYNLNTHCLSKSTRRVIIYLMFISWRYLFEPASLINIKDFKKQKLRNKGTAL